MNYFIVRKRQDEILMVMIEHGKGEIVLVIFPVNGVPAEISQRVVHPAHVPFESKAEATNVRRACNQWPGGRFLRNGDHSRMLRVREMVEMAEELHGFEVFPPAELVGNPLAFLA